MCMLTSVCTSSIYSGSASQISVHFIATLPCSSTVLQTSQSVDAQFLLAIFGPVIRGQFLPTELLLAGLVLGGGLDPTHLYQHHTHTPMSVLLLFTTQTISDQRWSYGRSFQ